MSGLKGFTMIELIIVITLIGILGVYAQSRFDTVTFDERFFADDLISSLRFAQKYALTSGCGVQFNLTTTGFNVKSETNTDCSDTDPDITTFDKDVLRPWQGGAYVNQAPLPASITLTPDSIVFYPQGWACTSGGESTTTEQITLTGQSATRTINIECSTGFVHQT